MQFSLIDSSNPTASPQETYQKFRNLVCTSEEEDDPTLIPPDELEDDADHYEETLDEADDPTKPELVEKRRRLRLRRLKRKSLAARAYQFSGSRNGVQGIVFMEIIKITDLPPERNGMTSSGPSWT